MFSEQELQMWHKITITWFMYWAHREYSVETYVNIRKGITHECIFWTDDSIYRNNTGVCLRTVYEKRTEQEVFFELSCLVEVLFNIVLHVTSNYSAHDKFSFRARKDYKSNFLEIGERNRAAGIGGD